MSEKFRDVEIRHRIYIYVFPQVILMFELFIKLIVQPLMHSFVN